MVATMESCRISTALFREAWPRHAAKRLAAALNLPIDTAANYVHARSRLTVDALLAAAARDEALLHALEARLHAIRHAHASAVGAHAGGVAAPEGLVGPAPAGMAARADRGPACVGTGA